MEDQIKKESIESGSDKGMLKDMLTLGSGSLDNGDSLNEDEIALYSREAMINVNDHDETAKEKE